MASIADVAALMAVAAVGVELVLTVETLPAEAALGVTFEAGLWRCTRDIVAMSDVSAKLRKGVEGMLVGEDLFVGRT